MANVEEAGTDTIIAGDGAEESTQSTTQENGGTNAEPEEVKSKAAAEDTTKREDANAGSKEAQQPGDKVNGSTSVTLSGNTEYACYSPGSKQECWAITSCKAPYYEPSSRASVDIVAVIDKSGSMGGQKIALVRKTLEFVIDQLKETDRISLVVYDTNVELVFGLMKMNQINREKARKFVSSIHEGSSTNLCGGLVKGMEQIALTVGEEKSQVQSVLLLTDGLANHGITTKVAILEKMKKMQNEGLGSSTTAPIKIKKHPPRKAPSQSTSSGSGFFSFLFNWGSKQPDPQQQKQEQQEPQEQQGASAAPVEKTDLSLKKFDGTVYTFGFGSDHDADMLEAISTQGGGVYYYIDTNEKIPESFADCLGGLLSVVGQNVSVKLEAQGDVIIKKVHTSRTINWTTPEKSCEVPMGDIQSEESRDLVLEMQLPSGSQGKNVLLMKAELSYFNVITSQFDTTQCLITTDRTDDKKGSGNVTVDIQRNRVLTAEALKDAESLASQNNLKAAQECLQKTLDRIEGSISKDEDLVKLLLVDLKKCMDAMKNRETFMSYGRNYVRSKQQSHSAQRSNYVEDFDDEPVSTGYMNMSRQKYRDEATSKKSSWW